jgi:hypothetical protein
VRIVQPPQAERTGPASLTRDSLADKLRAAHLRPVIDHDLALIASDPALPRRRARPARPVAADALDPQGRPRPRAVRGVRAGGDQPVTSVTDIAAKLAPPHASNGTAPNGDDLAARLEASRVDLVACANEVPAEPVYVPTMDGMLPAGARVECAAPAKAEKSIAWLTAGVDIVLAGGHVVILDRENGADEYARRLGDIMTARQLRPDERQALSNRLQYHAWPALTLADGANLAHALGRADLVIFDSSRKHLSALKLEENKSDDFARFTDAMLDPLSRGGIACVVLDNTGWDENGRPRGTSSKVDLVDIVFILEQALPFDRKRKGRIRLRRTHARMGSIGDAWHMDIGGGMYGSWTGDDHDAAREQETREARERFRLACVTALQEHAPLGRDPLIKAARDHNASGTDRKLRGWLAALGVDPASGIESGDWGYRLNTATPLGGHPPPRVRPPPPPAGPLGDAPIRDVVPGGSPTPGRPAPPRHAIYDDDPDNQ